MGTLAEDLTSIKNVEDTLIANKVARFSYTDTAYTNNDANGVDTYDFNHEQNIPNPNTSVLKVNATVLDKGYRSQASSITRMLVNHFFGRVSYNLNKINDNMSSLIATLRSHSGTANGFATLDSNGRIPYSQLPESAIELKGYWNAQTNTPTLADGTGTNGDEYFVDTAGSQDLGSGEQYFKVGDRVVYTGGVWKNIDSGSVRSVNNQVPDSTGDVKSVLGENIPMSDDMILQTYAYDMLRTTLVPESIKDEETWYQRMKFIQGHWYNFGLASSWTPCRRSTTSDLEGTYEVIFNNDVILDITDNGENTILALTGKYTSGWIYVDIQRSTDGGITWTKVVEQIKTSLPMNRSGIEFDSMLAYGNGVWLINFGGAIVSSDNQLMISDDTETWTELEVVGLSGLDIKCNSYYPVGNFFVVSTNSGHSYKVYADIQNPNPTSIVISGSTSARSGIHNIYYNGQNLYLCSQSGGLYSNDGGATFSGLSTGYGGYLDKLLNIFYTSNKVYRGSTDITPTNQFYLDTHTERIGNCYVSYGKVDSQAYYVGFTKNLYLGEYKKSPYTIDSMPSTLFYYTKDEQGNITVTPVSTSGHNIGQILGWNGAIYIFISARKCLKYSLDSMKVANRFSESIHL